MHSFRGVGGSPRTNPPKTERRGCQLATVRWRWELYVQIVEGAFERVAITGVALFREIAKMYEEGYLGRTNQIAQPTHVKEKFTWTSKSCRAGASCA